MPRHAMSRFFSVTESVIDACQRDYLAGRPPNHTVSYLALTDARIIVAESLEADALLTLGLEELVARLQDPVGDWGLVVAYEMVTTLAELGRERGKATQEQLDTLHHAALSILERVLDSPAAGPLVWYDGVFSEVAQHYVRVGDTRGVELRVRQLAHILRFDSKVSRDGSNVSFVLRDLADAFLSIGEYERGLALYAALACNDPTDIWVYNSITLIADDVGLPRMGAEAARRGLALLDAEGDTDKIRGQIAKQLQHLESGSVADREDQLQIGALADLRTALKSDFVPGPQRPWADFARALVPELADAYVKVPAVAPDLPPVSTTATRTKLGRNDPCWCGSGRKFKHCHMAEDRANLLSLEDLHCSGVRWCIAVEKF